MDYRIYTAWEQVPLRLREEADGLLVEAFPPEERRGLEEFHSLLRTTRLELLLALEGEEVLGFLMVWNLPELAFLENFAVSRQCRGRGIGSHMLDYVAARWGKPVLLEVEPPEGELQRRRIGFYERKGFHLNGTYPYLMPGLHPGAPALTLLLMSRPAPMTDGEAREAAALLYREVYAGKEIPPLP